MILCLILAPFLVVVPDFEQAPKVFLAVLFSIVSLMLISWAYARAEAGILIPVEYTAFVWPAIFGTLSFAESLTITTMFGISLIVSGCLMAALQKPDRIEHVENTSV